MADPLWSYPRDYRVDDASERRVRRRQPALDLRAVALSFAGRQCHSGSRQSTSLQGRVFAAGAAAVSPALTSEKVEFSRDQCDSGGKQTGGGKPIGKRCDASGM